jgi:valine--pyruvate aminotransferase
MGFSEWGERLSAPAAILDLMDDLGEALHQNPQCLFLGGGNPAMVPEAQAAFLAQMRALAADASVCQKLLGLYQSPRGDEAALAALRGFFAQTGRSLAPEQLALCSGSQTALFLLFNLLAGRSANGSSGRILLPLVPEYLGYADQGLMPGQFVSLLPLIHKDGPHRFRYALDSAALEQATDITAVCLSSPTNPSGAVWQQADADALCAWANARQIPVIVDAAYGMPFPGLSYTPAPVFRADQLVEVWSLSKLGLPGVRTSLVSGPAALMQRFVKANTLVGLANGNLGPALLRGLIESGDLQRLTQEEIPAFYRRQRDGFVALLDEALAGFDYRIHHPEGAFFIWLWLPDLPISSAELYQRLKARGLLVMAGEGFFFEWQAHWPHARQCLRLSYCQPLAVLESAVACLAAELQGLLPRAT